MIITENTKEEIILPEIGTRTLSDDQFNSIRHILKYIFNSAIDFRTLDKMAFNIAGSLIENDINFESALSIWKDLEANIEVLEKAYKNPEETRTKLSFEEILFENGENLFDPKNNSKNRI